VLERIVHPEVATTAREESGRFHFDDE